MEVPDLINLLKKLTAKPENNAGQVLDRVEEIARYGQPSHICQLMDFLKSPNIKVREAACRTIIHLFKRINPQNSHYEILRSCLVTPDDLDLYQQSCSLPDFVVLLAISSFNRNGFVREKAVQKLGESGHPSAIPFLIFRCADWVLPVRQAAFAAISEYKSQAYLDQLIENIPTIEWLKGVGRVDLGGMYQELMDFITVTNRAFVFSSFKKYPEKLRLMLAVHLSGSPSMLHKEWDLFLSDRHFLVRKLALDHFEKLEEKQIAQLLRDRNSGVRLLTLYAMKDRTGFEHEVKKFLADEAATIRHFARFSLKHSGINFATYYQHNLEAGSSIPGSISGLADLDAKPSSETVKGYLNYPRTKVRKAAFLALTTLDEPYAFQYALSNLGDLLPGLRKAVIGFLAPFRTKELLEKVRSVYTGGNSEQKKDMLKLMSKMGGMAVMPDLMLATVDPDESIRKWAQVCLQSVQAKKSALFYLAKEEEIEKARQVFDQVFPLHKEKSYFESNPLIGLDSYFK